MTNDFLREYYESIERMNFQDKLTWVKDVNNMSEMCHIRHCLSSLGLDGYLCSIAGESVTLNEGDHYVYLWKHAWGDPFYVGSGKGDRWTTKNGRCNDFYLHLDAADAVVYMVLRCANSKTARLYERYVSTSLTCAGYTLTNGDNNAEYRSGEARARMIEKCREIEGLELTKRVEDSVIRILSHNPRCDYRVTDKFLMEYGTDYFSRKYVFNKTSSRA